VAYHVIYDEFRGKMKKHFCSIISSFAMFALLAGLIWGGIKKREFDTTVYIAQGTSRSVVTAVVAAINHINNVTGETVFLLPEVTRREDSGSLPFLVFSVSVGQQQSMGNYVGATRHSIEKPTGRVIAAQVELVNTGSPAGNFLVALHEFGHVLGLDHDQDRNSVMFPIAHSYTQKLTKNDVEYLKRVYVR
jgi:hypothetical protein